MPPRKGWAAVYCRLSKEDEEKTARESESIRNQRALLLAWAAEHDYRIFRVYTDEDYSGIDRARPGFNAMLADARAGKFEVILAKTQSRFTRDMELVEKYLHGLFPEWGVRFIAVLDHVDTCDPAAKRHARSTDLSMSGTWRICPGMCGLCWTTSGAAGATLRVCALRLPEGPERSQPSAPGRTRRADRAADICAVPAGKRRGQDRPDPQRAGRAAAVRLPRGQCWPAAPHARVAVVQGNGAAHSVHADLRGRSGAGPRAQAELQVPQSHPPAAGGLDHRTRHPRAAHQPGGFCSGAGAADGAWRTDSGSAPPAGWACPVWCLRRQDGADRRGGAAVLPLPYGAPE